jgi:hypothetical protein
MLADYAGNLEGLERWAPNVMQSGLSRRQRDRPTIETPFGPAIGTRINFEVQNRRLTVWYAVSKSIDVQLSQGSAEDLAESQIEFARPLSTEPDALTIGEEDAIFSATPDGSIFALVLE